MLENLNQSVLSLDKSAIRDFNKYAKEHNAKYFLTLGEPIEFTPNKIKEATCLALSNNETFYGETNGAMALRQAIIEHELNIFKREYQLDEVLITPGSTFGIYLAFQTLLNHDDEVIIITPAYPLYAQLAHLCKAQIKYYDSVQNPKIDKEALEQLITPRTKLMIINTPHNPTGHVYSNKTLKVIASLAAKYHFYIICDECYSQIVYSQHHTFTPYPEIRNQLIIIQSFSKPYAMCGWRLGYLLAPALLCEKMSVLSQNLLVAPNSFIQAGAIEALKLDISPLINNYQKKRDYAYQALSKMKLPCMKPQGAFYLFPCIKAYSNDSQSFCKDLINKSQVALLPGSIFECEGYVRLSYCVDFATLKQALSQLEQYLK